MFKRFMVFSVYIAASLSIFTVNAVEKDVISMMSVKDRLERVERLVGSDMLMQQSQRIEALQEEISVLREQLDQQGYELSTLKQRQRSLYLDMDRRLHTVETTSGSSGKASAMPSSGVAEVSMPGNGLVNAPGNSGLTANVAVVDATPEAGANGKLEYDRAIGLLKDGRYKQAIVAFEGFLKKFSTSQYADNAQYWLGEANYANRDYKQALSEFQRLITNYPDSSKVAGARLKIAYVYYELQNWPAAQESLQQIIKLYPDSSVAKSASERLERIKREGH
ncbi:MAG: tol-pal system protein YbgF [Gammaproteobacteria bacterium]|nr:tol-pal system protein YbgF [Gammaproteobacteria bacterium]